MTDGLETTYTFDFLNVAQYHISGKNLVQNNFEKKSISIFFSESLEFFFLSCMLTRAFHLKSEFTFNLRKREDG